MLAIRQTIERQIRLKPIEIRRRAVDTGTCRGAPHSSMERCHPGVAEQIEEVLAFCLLAKPGPQRSMVQKQTRVEIIVQIDQGFYAAFAHDYPVPLFR